MNALESHTLFEKWRDRLEWVSSDIENETNINKITYKKIIKKLYSPKYKTLKLFMDHMPYPNETLILPFLDDIDMRTQAQCDWLDVYLSGGDPDSALPIIEALESDKRFERDINKQYLLCKKAELMVLQNKPLNDVKLMVSQALRITNKKSHDLTNKPLILYEPELKHVLAQAHINHGDADTAVSILMDIIYGLDNLPSDVHGKKKRTAPILLSLAKCQLHQQDIEGCIASCDEGFDISAGRHQGQLCPDFEFVKVRALKSANRISDAALLTSLNSIYACFILLNERHKIEAVATYAQSQNIKIDTALFDCVPQTYKKAPYERKNPIIHYKDNMFLLARDSAGLTQEEVSSGLRHVSAYTKLENNNIDLPDVYFAEAVMQRMGRDIELDRLFVVSHKQFEGLKLRKEIDILASLQRYDEAHVLLENLSKLSDYKNGIGLQFVLAMRAYIYDEKHGADHQYLALLLEAIKVTIPDFNINDIHKYPLTLEEATIIMNIANYYMKHNHLMRANNIFNMLLENIIQKWFDESLIAGIFSTLSYNYSRSLGRSGQRTEALSVLEEALTLDIKWGRLYMLPNLIYNKCFILQKLNGNTDEVCNLYKLCCYAANLFANHGKGHTAQLANKKLTEHWGIDLSI